MPQSTRLISAGALLESTPAAPVKRKGPCLKRRTGQMGSVYQPHKTTKRWDERALAYGRVWVDTPTERVRKTVALGICPTRALAKAKLRVFIESQGINAVEHFAENTTPATTFKQQANKWIESLSTRRRRPVKPATIAGWEHCLDRWVLPNLGTKPLSDIKNKEVQELGEVMSAAGLSPKTIVNNVAVVKMVVASAVNTDGEQIYPRTWNHTFIGLPIVDRSAQERQTVSQVQLQIILANVLERYAPLLTLIAGTGLRIGEALGLRHSDFSNECRVLHIQRSVWKGKP